ncbi:hypothetical protein HANVADRAFT_54320, partial [Hanseniaspora valbyensis NRRL Y-1626]
MNETNNNNNKDYGTPSESSRHSSSMLIFQNTINQGLQNTLKQLDSFNEADNDLSKQNLTNHSSGSANININNNNNNKNGSSSNFIFNDNQNGIDQFLNDTPTRSRSASSVASSVNDLFNNRRQSRINNNNTNSNNNNNGFEFINNGDLGSRHSSASQISFHEMLNKQQQHSQDNQNIYSTKEETGFIGLIPPATSGLNETNFFFDSFGVEYELEKEDTAKRNRNDKRNSISSINNQPQIHNPNIRPQSSSFSNYNLQAGFFNNHHSDLMLEQPQSSSNINYMKDPMLHSIQDEDISQHFTDIPKGLNIYPNNGEYNLGGHLIESNVIDEEEDDDETSNINANSYHTNNSNKNNHHTNIHQQHNYDSLDFLNNEKDTNINNNGFDFNFEKLSGVFSGEFREKAGVDSVNVHEQLGFDPSNFTFDIDTPSSTNSFNINHENNDVSKGYTLSATSTTNATVTSSRVPQDSKLNIQTNNLPDILTQITKPAIIAKKPKLPSQKNFSQSILSTRPRKNSNSASANIQKPKSRRSSSASTSDFLKNFNQSTIPTSTSNNNVNNNINNNNVNNNINNNNVMNSKLANTPVTTTTKLTSTTPKKKRSGSTSSSTTTTQSN